MNQSFYIGAGGAQQQLYHLNVHGDNIANVNTYGFKANRSYFSALMYQNWPGVVEAQDTELPMGVGTKMLMTSTDFSQGSPSDTGRELDFYIDGEGFFGLVDLTTGDVSFTRNGAFYMSQLQQPTGAIDENGQPVMEGKFYLGDGTGKFVLSERGGLIELTDMSDGALDALSIGVFDFANYDGMAQLDKTRYLPIDKNGNLWYGDGQLVRKRVELSNADLGDELTKVIEAQRAYGAALKMVITSDEIESTINNLRS
jgi:flagellar basal-body rod protein FlgG